MHCQRTLYYTLFRHGLVISIPMTFDTEASRSRQTLRAFYYISVMPMSEAKRLQVAIW